MSRTSWSRSGRWPSTAPRPPSSPAAARHAGALAIAFPGATVIAADHGHLQPGGHGGDEDDACETRVVFAGPGVRDGARLGKARNLDLAPTLAALLGVSAPKQAE